MKTRLFYIAILCMLSLSVYSQQSTTLSKDIWLNEINVAVKVNCIEFDKDGYMWAGTDEGLYTYNGRSFSLIKTGNENAVTAISILGDGILAGFHNGELGFWDGQQYNKIPLKGTLPTDAISSIKVLSANVFILSTVGSGIYFVFQNNCTQYNTSNGLSDDYVYTILNADKHTLLAATDQGINEIILKDKQPSIKNYTTADGLPDNIVRVLKPLPGSSWSWIGTHQGGIALYCSKTKQVWTPAAESWRWGQINDICPIGDQRAWVCTEAGYLLHVQLENEDSLSITPHYFPGQKLFKLQKDKAGNIWCATNLGLKQIPSENILKLPIPSPYSIQDITALTCDMKNRIWIAQKDKLYLLNREQEHNTLQPIFTAQRPITQLYCDKNNVVWMATFGDGLWYCMHGSTFTKVKGIDMLEQESILDVSGNGEKLWVSGLHGVEEFAVMQNNKLLQVRIHNKSAGMGSDYVYKIFPDSRGRVWMATDGAGVSRYHLGKYTHWDSTAGMNSKVIYSITEDLTGRIWASTFNNGILAYHTGIWYSMGREQGLQSLKITSLAPTADSGLLIVHSKGIDEWQEQSKQFRHYERRTGVGIDTMSSALNLVTTDTTGNLYIPYQDGLLEFGRKDYRTNIIPDVKIKSIHTFYRDIYGNNNRLRHAENHVTFKYEGVNLANPDMLFYRYKLEGYNDDWILTKDESVTFPQIPSGDYTFTLQVSTSNSFATYGEDIHHFSIAKPYWYQWWFIALSLGMLWMAVTTYVRIRERNLRRLSALQKERMMFEYEHLKSQVNPHFLFNSLNTLTGLIEENKDGAIQYTTQLSDLYRNMLSHKDKDLITLGEEWEILENYIYIQQSRFGNALKLIVDIPETLKKSKRIVPMALQLLLENAIKHNIVSKDKPLTVCFRTYNDKIIVSNTYQPKMSKEKGAGLGLSNIKNRYAQYTKRAVTSGIEQDEFIVIIPLL